MAQEGFTKFLILFEIFTLFITGCSFVDQLSTRMTTISREISQIRGGHVYVVDIAKLTDDEQTLVFGDILRTLYGLYSGEVLLEEGEAELPDKVIVFVDELNKYAPARGEAGQSPILEQVLDIPERGRSLGIVLFRQGRGKV